MTIAKAEKRMALRALDYYDAMRAQGIPDYEARDLTNRHLRSKLLRLSYVEAAERLADALASRAAARLAAADRAIIQHNEE